MSKVYATILILPFVTSQKRAINLATVDFPPPEWPYQSGKASIQALPNGYGVELHLQN